MVFLIKETGKSRFIGRILQRTRDGMVIFEDKEYFTKIMKDFGMTDCKEASTPSAMTTTLTTDSEYLYRSVVGQRQWEAPVRPDGAFTINELTRDLNQPTVASFRNLKHLLRYKNEHFTIRFYCNQSSSSIPQGELIIVIPVDANWAGCTKTRKSTSGVLMEFLGVPVHFISKTQSVIAQSSTESELYAIGSEVAEGLHNLSFLTEARLSKNVTLEIQTDSSSAKSIAKQYGTSRKTRHIKLRYLFMQDLVQSGIPKITKISGDANPLNIWTNFPQVDLLRRHLQRIGIVASTACQIFTIK